MTVEHPTSRAAGSASPRRRRLRGLAGAVVAVVLAAAFLAVAPVRPAPPADAALASGTQPQLVRSIGGQGRPGVFAWGLQWNPVTQEVLVGDYLNFVVRRYDATGHLLGQFWRPGAAGQPYSLAVDPRDGSVYVAELKDNPLTAAIAKYDRTGRFLYAVDAVFTPPTPTSFTALYPVWMTVEEDTGDLLVLDSHLVNYDPSNGSFLAENPPRLLRLRFDDAQRSVTQVSSFKITPPDSSPDSQARSYGVDIGDDDRIYISDSVHHAVHVYRPDGTWLDTFGEEQTGTDNRGVVVDDAADRVYVTDAQHSDIDVFRRDGTYVRSFGSEGDAPGQFTGGGRQLDLDDQGRIWVADYGGFEVEQFAPDGTPLLHAPDPRMGPPPGLLAQPRDVAVDRATGEVWVADAWAQRFQRFAADGRWLGAWGRRGGNGPYAMNYPRHVAVQPATAATPKRLWVVNERGHHIRVYDVPTTGDPVLVRQVGNTGDDDTDDGHFRWPGDVEFATWGGRQVAVVTDRIGNAVKVLDAATFRQLDVNPANDDPDLNFISTPSSGAAVDPVSGDIWVGAGTSVKVYDSAGNLRATYGSEGTSLGQFKDTADLTWCDGQVLVVDEATATVTAMAPDGTALARWGTSYAQGPYDFKGPAGIDCDSQGRVYVADSGNDRVQVFDLRATRATDTVAPAAPVVTAPAQSSVLPLAAVELTGTASDDRGVAQVEISVRDADTGLWWDASDASWETTRSASLAAWTAAPGAGPASTVSWRWVFAAVRPAGRYLVEVRTRDVGGTLDAGAAVVRSFAMPGATPPALPPGSGPDTTPPDGTLEALGSGARPPGQEIVLRGRATDDVGVASVRLSVRDSATGLWWNGLGSTGFSSAFKAFPATLSDPGATSTAWTWSWTPRAEGTYVVRVEARDAAGNLDPTRPTATIRVSAAVPDITAPTTAVDGPAAGSTVPSTGVDLTGTAADDVGVAGVRLAIQDSVTKLWWTGTAWGAWTALGATTTPTTAGAVSWTYRFAPRTTGRVGFHAWSVDAAGNTGARTSWRSLTTE